MRTHGMSMGLILILLTVVLTTAQGDEIIENFSGTGPYTANGGPAGFDADGWFRTGNAGSFSTNGFGESVYNVVSNSSSSSFEQDGLVRTVGDIDFNSVFEFSNPVIANIFSSISIGIFDVGLGSMSVLNLQKNGSTFTSNLFYDSGSGSQHVGSFSTSQTVEQATLYFNSSADLINGGCNIDAYVEFNESGMLNLVGSIDGTEYTNNASASRTIYVLANSSFGGSVAAGFDRFTINVPEPTLLIPLLAIGIGFIRQRIRLDA
jgi:hypothetical protein